MKSVDLNVDLAEGCDNDEILLSLVSSANICCGIHAGDYYTMLKAIRWAKANNVCIGAHPSFPDRDNFGRNEMQLTHDQLNATLLYQLGAITALCENEGAILSYVKPHGALYNQASRDKDLAQQIVNTIHTFNPQLKLMGLSGSLLLNVAEEAGLQTISEVFADRRYLADGSLVPRSRNDAMVENDEQAIQQVLQMVLTGTVRTVEGKDIVVKADSICLHGDGTHAVLFAQKIRRVLEENGIEILNIS